LVDAAIRANGYSAPLFVDSGATNGGSSGGAIYLEAKQVSVLLKIKILFKQSCGLSPSNIG
jgi:hypothetical protein